MRILDIYVEGISGYLGEVATDAVRRKVFEGLDLEKVRLDIFLGENVINYGYTSIYSLNRDMIYEIEQALAGISHYFQLDGYDFLKLEYFDGTFKINLAHTNGQIVSHLIAQRDLLNALIKCLRVAENAIDALRYR